MQNYVFTFLTVFALLFFVTPVSNVHAQVPNLGNQANPSVLALSPQHPEPNETVTATLNDYSVNTSGASIQWFIGGTEVPNSKNERSIEFSTGPLGSSIQVLAVTSLPNGTVLKAQKTVRPIRLDILVEADTRVPTFYKGRSIPSSGGTVRLTAIPFTGEKRSPESYSYTWRVEDKVQGGGSRFGKNSIDFTAGFQTKIKASVDVIDTDGSIVTSESIEVPLTDPELYFYEINPLRGMAEIAMSNTFIFVGEEIRVRAEPYFIDNSLFLEKPHQEWKLNNKTVINPSPEQQEITLRRSGDSGSFTLEYHVRNLKQLLQGVKDSVTVRF